MSSLSYVTIYVTVNHYANRLANLVEISVVGVIKQLKYGFKTTVKAQLH